MASCPIKYVRKSQLCGTLFGDEDDEEGRAPVSCAYTQFWVDHKEPEVALKVLKAKGVKWPLGELPQGCEFLVLVEVRSRKSMHLSYPLMLPGYKNTLGMMGNRWHMASTKVDSSIISVSAVSFCVDMHEEEKLSIP
jgi:hypothetical protein